MGIIFTHKLIMCKQNCIGFRSGSGSGYGPGPGSGAGVFCTPDRSQLFGSNWRDICDETNVRNGSWSTILQFCPGKCSIRFVHL